MCALLMLVTRSVTRIYSQEFRDAGLEVTQHAMLMALTQMGPMTQGELGERMAVDKTTVSRNVKIMERNGWLSLAEDDDDARQRIVAVTDTGKRTLASARPAWLRAQARLKSALPGGEFESLKAHLPEIALAAMRA
jgi:DNA-binding MarR family transcriptional regulator